MLIDRSLQLKILTALAQSYPSKVGLASLQESFRSHEPLVPIETFVGVPADEVASRRVWANLEYLAGHALTELYTGQSGANYYRISSNGLDFLQDDGGLRAILGVVTVRLHDDTIKQLLTARINASSLPPETKKRWTDRIREIGSKSIEHVLNEWLEKGVDAAIEHGPAALDALEGMVFGG